VTAVPYNAGHGRHAFATRVRAIRQHPEVWRQVPDGLTVDDYRRGGAGRQLWDFVAAFLRTYGLLSEHTASIDVNVPKLVAAVRRLEREDGPR